MIIKTLYIKGFRNFKEVTVNFNEHSLIIGANDVGKTNLIYALRILLDRSFSDYDYELAESDFFAYIGFLVQTMISWKFHEKMNTDMQE